MTGIRFLLEIFDKEKQEINPSNCKMHSMHNECLEMINPVLHDDSGQVHHQSNNNLNLKRKYPYDRTDDQCQEKSVKRIVNLHECNDPVTSAAIDSNNVDQQQLIIYNNDKYLDHNPHNLDHNEVNVEFINIMFDNNLLPVQQNTIISEANFISDAGWNSVDLLDLDQSNYFYETTTNIIEDISQKPLHKTVPSNYEFFFFYFQFFFVLFCFLFIMES